MLSILEMSSKNYEIKFEIAGGIRRNFLSSFKKAAQVTKNSEDVVRRYNQEMGRIDGFLKQTEASRRLYSQYFKQKAALDGLNSAILDLKTPMIS